MPREIGQTACKICLHPDDEERDTIDRELLSGRATNEIQGTLSQKHGIHVSRSALTKHYKHLRITEKAQDLLADHEARRNAVAVEAAKKIVASIDEMDTLYTFAHTVLTKVVHRLVNEPNNDVSDVKLWLETFRQAQDLIRVKYELVNGKKEHQDGVFRDGGPTETRQLMAQIFGANAVPPPPREGDN